MSYLALPLLLISSLLLSCAGGDTQPLTGSRMSTAAENSTLFQADSQRPSTRRLGTVYCTGKKPYPINSNNNGALVWEWGNKSNKEWCVFRVYIPIWLVSSYRSGGVIVVKVNKKSHFGPSAPLVMFEGLPGKSRKPGKSSQALALRKRNLVSITEEEWVYHLPVAEFFSRSDLDIKDAASIKFKAGNFSEDGQVLISYLGFKGVKKPVDKDSFLQTSEDHTNDQTPSSSPPRDSNTIPISLKGVEGHKRTIVHQGDGEEHKIIHVHLPKGRVGSASGITEKISLHGKFQRVYLEYFVKFSPNFQCIPTLGQEQTGKLPGLAGGKRYSGKRGQSWGQNRGWSVRVNWREFCKANLYLYHLGQKGKSGEDLPIGKLFFQPGKTYKIGLLVQLNDKSRSNGSIQVWINNRKAVEHGQIRFQNREKFSGEIDKILFHVFLGGGDDRWAHDRDEEILIWGLRAYSLLKGVEAISKYRINTMTKA
jgi:hypothetical protein